MYDAPSAPEIPLCRVHHREITAINTDFARRHHYQKLDPWDRCIAWINCWFLRVVPSWDSWKRAGERINGYTRSVKDEEAVDIFGLALFGGLMPHGEQVCFLRDKPVNLMKAVMELRKRGDLIGIEPEGPLGCYRFSKFDERTEPPDFFFDCDDEASDWQLEKYGWDEQTASQVIAKYIRESA